MPKYFTLVCILIGNYYAHGQRIQQADLSKTYSDLKPDKKEGLKYRLHLQKDSLYRISVFQQGVDVTLLLTDSLGKKIIEQDSPNGDQGIEKFEFTSIETNQYFLTIKALDDSVSGTVSFSIKTFTPREIQLYEQARLENDVENKKLVQTLDIDRFWEAFDDLKNCKSHKDSVLSFQEIYLDRGTEGLTKFILARDFSAEKFVHAVSRLPKFYASVRRNTLEIREAIPVLSEVFENLERIYPGFKPFKICFAIGLVNTGGTVADNYVLIGSEISASTKDVDVSEFKNKSLRDVLTSGDGISQKIKNIVSHESIHIQQNAVRDHSKNDCELLSKAMREGFCDYIGGLIAGNHINVVAHEYGNKHERELWAEFKNEMCSNHISKWLYNGSSTDRPADLGYYIGHQIAESYYKNAEDKRQAIVDIIGMDHALDFLSKSRYDEKFKN